MPKRVVDTKKKLKLALDSHGLRSVHPVAEVFPIVTGDDYTAMVSDVKEHGFQVPVIADKSSQLLDGRTRLCISYDLGIKCEVQTVDRNGSDVAAYIIALNLHRRHLTASQIAAIGPAILPEFEKEAKQRQREGRKRGGGDRRSSKFKKDRSKVNLPSSGSEHQARDDVAKLLGVSPKLISQAKKIAEEDEELLQSVRAGDVTVNDAYKQVRAREKRANKVEQQGKTQSEDLVPVVTVDGKSRNVERPKSVKFNRTTDNVDWASWTWNPVTGCEHGCEFCYARDIAGQASLQKYYPHGFKPAFHEYRLNAPKNTKVPSESSAESKRVFVCSMADLFGKWVPKEWINAVFDACLESPEWQYIFLTKWPAKYKQLPLVEGAWYGSSVVRQSDVRRVESALSVLQGKIIRWVNVEPMLEPIEFEDLSSWCSMVAIGSQTETHQLCGNVPAKAPEFDWVVDLVNQCRDAGVPYYLKANLGLIPPGMKLPKLLPRQF